MATHGRLPSEADVVVIGAGFAGASVAAALTRAGVTSGVVLEREPLPGSHASGRNAAMARQLEEDSVLRKLAIEGVRRLRAKNADGRPVLRQTGGLYLIHGKPDRAAEWRDQLQQYCVPSELLPADKARQRFVDKLLRHAPGLADISLRRSWACLRTFAPDRFPVIGWDPEIDGLFHVSGLGGLGVTTSLAVGDIASTLICGDVVDWIEVGSFSVGRGALRSVPQCNN